MYFFHNNFMFLPAFIILPDSRCKLFSRTRSLLIFLSLFSLIRFLKYVFCVDSISWSSQTKRFSRTRDINFSPWPNQLILHHDVSRLEVNYFPWVLTLVSRTRETIQRERLSILSQLMIRFFLCLLFQIPPQPPASLSWTRICQK